MFLTIHQPSSGMSRCTSQYYIDTNDSFSSKNDGDIINANINSPID